VPAHACDLACATRLLWTDPEIRPRVASNESLPGTACPGSCTNSSVADSPRRAVFTPFVAGTDRSIQRSGYPASALWSDESSSAPAARETRCRRRVRSARTHASPVPLSSASARRDLHESGIRISSVQPCGMKSARRVPPQSARSVV